MAITTDNAGFFGTDVECYYRTPSGRVWAYGSGDFDGVREIDRLPEGAEPIDGLLTPGERQDVCQQIQDEGGEILIEEAE